MELELTPEEAQVFWPVYNQSVQESQESQKAMRTAYSSLLTALENNDASDKEISKLLDEYLEAKKTSRRR